MEKLEYIELEKVVRKQEETLRFSHFTNKDALNLGNFLTDRIYEQGLELALCIRKINGSILFQHMTQGTCLNNQNWMMRKFNTVCYMERSSYGVWLQSMISGESVAVHGLSDSAYVFCGGGFPIALKNGEMTAVITVSNLPHEKDHQFIIDGITDWLKLQ